MFLPDSRYEGAFNDDEWIQEQLAKLPHAWKAGTVKRYSTVFQKDGRTAANTRLRIMVRDFGIK